MSSIYFSLIIISIMLLQNYPMIQSLNFISLLMLIYNIVIMFFFLVFTVITNLILNKMQKRGVWVIAAIDQLWLMMTSFTAILGTFLVYQGTLKEVYDIEKVVFGLICWTFPFVFSRRLVYVHYHANDGGQK